jgi:hypothetical protein
VVKRYPSRSEPTDLRRAPHHHHIFGSGKETVFLVEVERAQK